MLELTGYRGASRKLLEAKGVDVGDVVVVHLEQESYEGVLMPRYEYADDQHIVVKLKSGYNIGIDVKRVRDILRLAEGPKPVFSPPPLPKVDESLPKVSIISTGGTIASRVDYRTGAVRAALTATELYSTVPELSSLARIDCEVLYSIYSENITPTHWSNMALKVVEKLKEGVKGVVLTHGTDTMGYTSAALSFALQGIPVPVLLVGAQRSSDRPSSDAALNLIGAVNVAAKAPFSGVYLVMHSGLSDDRLAVHLGTKVRKNHTSRRDAFESVNSPPAAYVKGGQVEQVISDLPKRREFDGFEARPKFEEKVALLKFHPSFDPELIDHLVSKGYRGIILEGTGLGHVSKTCYSSIKRAIEAGVTIGMASQCIWGRVRMTVYDTGRDLLSIGVLPLGDMLPETALVKLMWVLANTKSTDEVKELMTKNLAGEYSERQSLERRPTK